MPSTPEILRIEKELADHRKIPATNTFTEMGWSYGQSDLMSEYRMALAIAGYKSLSERRSELQEQAKWRRLFSKHPIEMLPSAYTAP